MSSEKKKVDKQEIPDSTTKERNFTEGDEVFVLANDQFILGRIKETVVSAEKCLVTFTNGELLWASYKDLKRSTIDVTDSPSCVICKSSHKKNNVVVVCETCFRGYHQKCHKPLVEFVTDDWSCSKCREKKNCHLPGNSVNQKTASSTSKDSSLPPSSEDVRCDVNLLKLDENKCVNMTERNCTCGGSGDWYNKMIQCCSCHRWFHEKCVHCLYYPLYLGDRFYVFVCSMCNHGAEFVRRLHMSWAEITHLVIYNLREIRSKKKKIYHNSNSHRYDTFFDLDKDVLVYLKKHWSTLQLPPEILNVPPDGRRKEVLKSLKSKEVRFLLRYKAKKRILCGLRKQGPPSPPTFKLPDTRPITDSVLRNVWKDDRRLKYELPSDEIAMFKRTLPAVNGLRRSPEWLNQKRNDKSSLLPKGVPPVGHSLCIKRASTCNGDMSMTEKQVQKQQIIESRKTQRMKKLGSPTENKSTSCNTDTLSELPPTPPSSVSAPETPQPSIVNGEPPISPSEDVTCPDFDDVPPLNELGTLNLEEIFPENKEQSSDISFPYGLNPVIVDPLMRTLKRKLSEADFVMSSNGQVKVKRTRCRRRRTLNNVKLSEMSATRSLSNTPVKTVPRYSPVDSRTLVYKYFEEEKTQLLDQGVNKIIAGDQFQICGKRIRLDGRVEYLVEYVKCTEPI